MDRTGELSFKRLFSIFDEELEARRVRLTSSVMPDYDSYLKEISAVKAVEALLNKFIDLANKLAQNEED